MASTSCAFVLRLLPSGSRPPASLDTAAGPFTVYLSPSDVQTASVIGGGNVSAGVRLALAVYPL